MYTFTCKEKRLALGSYPEVSMKTARTERDTARITLQDGNDPAHLKQVGRLRNQQQADVAFEAVAREFHQKKASGRADHYGTWWIRRMETMAFQWIGKLPLDRIDAPVLLTALHRIEARGAYETAHTLCRGMGQVFTYGIQTGKCSGNPVSNLRGAPHLVPPADQAVALLRELQPLTRHGRHVFPSLLKGDRQMTNGINPKRLCFCPGHRSTADSHSSSR